jgi:hypothetical protein
MSNAMTHALRPAEKIMVARHLTQLASRAIGAPAQAVYEERTRIFTEDGTLQYDLRGQKKPMSLIWVKSQGVRSLLPMRDEALRALIHSRGADPATREILASFIVQAHRRAVEYRAGQAPAA